VRFGPRNTLMIAGFVATRMLSPRERGQLGGWGACQLTFIISSIFG
jgi:hypothetical protein